jgi:hypothetical protein
METPTSGNPGAMGDDRRGLDRALFVARRALDWGRAEGFSRLVEESQMNPVERVTTAARDAAWRSSHGMPKGLATPVFLFGVQRSGTNMVVRGLEASPAFEVHNENDRRAFDRYQLRPLDRIRAIVCASRARYVLFKPLCDCDRATEILDGLGTPMPPRAIWAYRGVDARVRSALAKFGDVNLRVLSDIAAGRGLDRWQARNISNETMSLIRSFDWSTMTPASAAALFWYVRNVAYFDQHLDERDDVVVVSYEQLTEGPRRVLEPVAAALGARWDDRFVAHIDRRSAAGRTPLELHPRVREVCDSLGVRLDAATLGAAQEGLDPKASAGAGLVAFGTLPGRSERRST